MNGDIHTMVQADHCKELLREVEEERRAAQVARQSTSAGRRMVGRLGNLLVAAGSRLEQFERSGKSIVYDVES